MNRAKPKRYFAAILLLACVLSTLLATPREPNVEQRINALLRRMTLAEKLGQLQQLDGEANGNFRPEHLVDPSELVEKTLARHS